MERSPDFEKLVQELVEAQIKAPERAEIYEMVSRADGTVMIGTDASEYTRDIAVARRANEEFAPTASSMSISAKDTRGYVEGDVGWFDGRWRFELEDKAVEVRMTGVAHKEDGQWRFVQSHTSIGVPTEHMFDPMFHQEQVGAAT